MYDYQMRMNYYLYFFSFLSPFSLLSKITLIYSDKCQLNKQSPVRNALFPDCNEGGGATI